MLAARRAAPTHERHPGARPTRTVLAPRPPPPQSIPAPPPAYALPHAVPPAPPEMLPPENAWPRALAEAFTPRPAAPAAPPAQGFRAPAANPDIVKLKTEIARLELLVKKLQTELQIERQYNQAPDQHVPTLTTTN